MKAMILAAGLGTRLRPHTNDRPKALVTVAGKTLLEHAIEKLLKFGVTEVIINIHHFHDMMKEFISGLSYNELNIRISDEQQLLLDTGGGLWKAKEFFNKSQKPFFLFNVDIISDIDLAELYKAHIDNKAIATLAVSRRNSTRTFLWDNNRLCGWKNNKTGEVIYACKTSGQPEQLAFSGIHCISPEIFSLYQGTGIFSIKDVYLKLASQHNISPFIHNPAGWFDTGTIDNLKKAEAWIKNSNS